MAEGEAPLVVLHSFGLPGTGGPVAVVDSLEGSDLSARYDFVRMTQTGANGAIDVRRIITWARFLRRTRPDIVHVCGLGNEGFHAVVAARLAGCKRVLVTVHGTHRDLVGASGLKHWVMTTLLEPATLVMASRVATVCEFAATRRFVTKFSRKPVAVTANGVRDLSPGVGVRDRVRDSLGLQPDDLALVSVGRLSEQKGHADLDQALRLLPAAVANRVVLVVVGGGPDEVEIRQRYESAGVRTLFLGVRRDVPDVLAACDLFVFPTWHENLSIALLEAMSVGLPVVATSVGGNTEVVERGGGVLVSPRQPTELAAAIGRLLVDEELRTAMALEARSVAQDSYSLESMAAANGRVYASMLGSAAR